MISGTDGLLVGGDGGAKISDAGSNGFANEDNVDLVLVFGSILWWCFLFIMPAPIFDREVLTDFPNFSFPISKGRLKKSKKIIMNGSITPYPIVILLHIQNCFSSFAFFLL